MLSPRFDDSFRRLVRSWENHARLAGTGDFAAQAKARVELDRARLQVAQIRRIAA